MQVGDRSPISRSGRRSGPILAEKFISGFEGRHHPVPAIFELVVHDPSPHRHVPIVRDKDRAGLKLIDRRKYRHQTVNIRDRGVFTPLSQILNPVSEP